MHQSANTTERVWRISFLRNEYKTYLSDICDAPRKKRSPSSTPGGRDSPLPCGGSGWTFVEGVCYFVSSESLPWAEAAAHCTDKGAHLTTLTTEGMALNLQRFISRQNK